jgi:DNA-binding transcriptional regulator YhcF (GntR family)
MNNDLDRNTPIPLHYQLYIKLKELFTSDFQPGGSLPTELEIAQEFNIGRGTVRIAMDNLVKEGIITRTQGKGTFLNDQYYIRLKQYNLGVVLSKAEFENKDVWEYTWVHHLEMINGIIEGTSRWNVTCEMIPEEVISSKCNEVFDGFILFRFVKSSIMDLITKPSVNLRYEVDLAGGFLMIARHIMQSDFSNIAYIGTRKKRRATIINNTFRKQGKPVIPKERIVECSGSLHDGYQACKKMYASGQNPDCIICSTDLRAIGVLRYLKEKGIDVPGRVSVYGFDGIRKAEVTLPPLTTCRFDWKYPGLFSVQSIRALLDGRKSPDYITPMGELVQRSSTRNDP